MAAQLTSKHISTACTAAARGSKPVAPVKLPASVLATAPVVRASIKPAGTATPASARREQRLSRTMAAATEVVTSEAATAGLQAAHGGKLVNLQAPQSEWPALIQGCTKTIEASHRNACDVELLSIGGFSPLTGFLNEDEYYSVVENMRMKSGLLLGIPVVFDTDREDVVVGDKVLITYQGQNIGVLTVESKWCPDKGLEQPKRVFPCASPAEVRATLPKDTDVLAFQCRNPIHKAHYELFTRALDAPNVREGAVCLVHPTVGPTQDDDIPGAIRYKTYEVGIDGVQGIYCSILLVWGILPRNCCPQTVPTPIPYKHFTTASGQSPTPLTHSFVAFAGCIHFITGLTLSFAASGGCTHSIFGPTRSCCTHFIIGRDMAGSKSCLTGEDFYGAYDAQNMASTHAAELGMQTVPSLNIAFTKEKGYVTADVAEKENLTKLNLSGTKFRTMLRTGEDIPDWFAFKSVIDVLRDQVKAEEGAK
ncbi:ATP sulfurylase [Dunaliella salina]|uniref:ATP sulfurylase n=1 Tax=Dunaliella salina TaxID=3046 RepID=A0ABQ7GIY1_DUNSA|nr:ATP sulfurylase [Dunaliella salina]|eukprot:KAF5834566.1 ATP sulfurylase [Dunaliella salina]